MPKNDESHLLNFGQLLDTEDFWLLIISQSDSLRVKGWEVVAHNVKVTALILFGFDSLSFVDLLYMFKTGESGQYGFCTGL